MQTTTQSINMLHQKYIAKQMNVCTNGKSESDKIGCVNVICSRQFIQTQEGRTAGAEWKGQRDTTDNAVMFVRSLDIRK